VARFTSWSSLELRCNPVIQEARDDRGVLVVEGRLPRFAVEAERAPDLTGSRPQAGDQLLVAAHRHVLVPPRAAGRVAAGRLVQRRNASLGPGDLRELVDVVLVVLLREPLLRQFRHALVEVTRHEQGRRIQRVPARHLVVRDRVAEDLGRRPPERDEVEPLPRQ
jgi:hypothetical protein